MERPEENKIIAMVIAMTVRNAMENFHAEHLSDEQMAELNPIIRNAIYTTLHALAKMGDSKVAESFIAFQYGLIPEYWEEPELLNDFLSSESMDDESNQRVAGLMWRIGDHKFERRGWGPWIENV